MTTRPRPHASPGELTLRLVPAALIALIVVAGLWAMHGIGSRVVCDIGPGVASAPGGVAHHDSAHVGETRSDPAAQHGGVDGCGDHTSAMACAVVLLLALPFLRPPSDRQWHPDQTGHPRVHPLERLALLPRAPALVALCISRT